MPTLPTTVRMIASCTPRLPSTRSSPRTDPADGVVGVRTYRSTNKSASTVTAATAAKVARQPKVWPTKVPIGVPRMMPRFRPSVSFATVEPSFPGGAVETATAMATAKKVATISPAKNRAISRRA
nr:hypothetical protein [Fodinicola feengrottensis]